MQSIKASATPDSGVSRRADVLLQRGRVLEHLATGARLTLVLGLPGYGKTVAVRQWIHAERGPTCWLSVEMLGANPAAFWSHFLEQIRVMRPEVGHEPAQLLEERGPDDPLFLTAVGNRLSTDRRAVVVLDGMDAPDPAVLRGLAYLVDVAGDALAFVVTARTEPNLPIARWQSLGWVKEIRQEVLRFTDDEAIAVGQALASTASSSELIELNRRFEGWPIGVHMAIRRAPHPGHAVADEWNDGSLSDYLVNGALTSLPEEDRGTALALSVVRTIDPELCRSLVGARVDSVTRQLLAQGLLHVVDRRTGSMQYHALVRELMEQHLGTTDPVRRVELHRRAAALWRERGDLNNAYLHLAAVGESDTAHEIVVGPALALVEAGDLVGLRQYAQRLPPPGEVEIPELALDLAKVSLYAEGVPSAKAWCAHADVLARSDVRLDDPTSPEARALRLRLHNRQCTVALFDADLATATVHIDQHRRLMSPTDALPRFERRFPVVAARVMLAARRREDAEFWIELAQDAGSEVIAHAAVPTLRAWWEWLFGSLARATAFADRAQHWIDANVRGPNHLAFDTLITASWCRLATGNLDETARLSLTASSDAELLGYRWHRLQAGYVAAQLALATRDPETALGIVDDLRARIDFERCQPYADRIVALDIEARAAAGVLTHPNDMIDELEPGPRSRLLRARIATSDTSERVALLAGHEGWPEFQRRQAEVILATSAGNGSPGDLAAVVCACARAGWVSVFLGLGDDVEAQLRALPLERDHPNLAHCLAIPAAGSKAAAPAAVTLTDRENSLLQLLPTHLSYERMGDELFLSVNTVKANLQRVYRKLGASNRSEAVESARRMGLLAH